MTNQNQRKNSRIGVTIVLYFMFLAMIPVGSFFVRPLIRQPQIPTQPEVAGVSTAKEDIEVPNLSILENQDQGYKLLYPDGYKIILTKDGVQFTPESGRGKIIISTKDKILSFAIDSADTNDAELANLKNIAKIIMDSFQFKEPEIKESEAL